jgi:hypothetical protein
MALHSKQTDCNTVRKQLSDFIDASSELSTQKTIHVHLDQCESCRCYRAQLEKTAELARAVELPELPDGFSSSIGERLQTQPEPDPAPALKAADNEADAVIPTSTLSRKWFERAMCVLGGALAAFLVWTAWHTLNDPESRTQTSSFLTRNATPGTVFHTNPNGELLQDLENRRIAVLTLTVHSPNEIEAAEVRVILSAGLAFAGKKKVFPEKSLEWKRNLRVGDNRIEVPIKALLPGKWSLTASVRAHRLERTIQAYINVRENPNTRLARVLSETRSGNTAMAPQSISNKGGLPWHRSQKM